MPATGSQTGRSAATEKKIAAKKKPTYAAPAKQPGPISDAENRKVSAYKRTRPYYRANVVAFQHRPQVQKIGKRLTAAKKTKNKAALTRAVRSYQREQRHGPDKIAGDAYRHYAGKLWQRSKGYYPGSDETPKAKVGYHGDPRYLAWVVDGDNTVHYSPAAIHDFMGPDRYPNGKRNRQRDNAKSVPLHEFTHTRQSDRTFRSKAATEGGAEAKAERVAKKLKIRYVPASPYRKYTKRAKRHPKFVRYGQFR